MGSLIHPEFSLDCISSLKTYVQRTIDGFLGEVSKKQITSEKILKLDDYLNRLQDEMRKIIAVQIELPLCMFLLNDVISIIKQELAKCKNLNSQPVLEEFLPLKKNCTKEDDDSKENDNGSRDKRNWMSAVQLWNSDNHHQNTDLSSSKSTLKPEDKKRLREEINRPGMDLFQNVKHSTGRKTFVSYKGCNNIPMTVEKGEKDDFRSPRLSLCMPQIKNSNQNIKPIDFSTKLSSSRSGFSSAINVQSDIKTEQQQTTRKRRRCWSPELHRSFINALQQLGGAQVATPKQIRELMQVDGLTNDEVKSHLQKYRLHTRRVATKTSTTQPGGLWPSQEQCDNSQSRSPQSPLQLAGSSPESSEGDSIGDQDDEKSESHSWTHHHLSGRDDALFVHHVF